MCGLELERAYTGLKRDRKAVEVALELTRLYPDDPEILYQTGKIFGNFAFLTMLKLAEVAPSSVWRQQAAAEADESQGSYDQAIQEYNEVLKLDPQRPGIHYRIGRSTLGRYGQRHSADDLRAAEREFEQELAVDPSNAGAEYVLGELAAQAQQWDEAIGHFSRAAKLDSGFGDAFLGWGAALVSTKKFSEAVAPLETAVKLQPQNPAAHYNLAIAYTRTGRKEDGEREFSVHREMIKSRQPGDAQPEHDRGLARPGPQVRLPVHAGRENLQQGRGIGGHGIGHGVQERVGNRHVFREAAVAVAAEQAAVPAKIRQVAAAQVTVTAERSRVHEHSRSRGNAVPCPGPPLRRR